MLLLTGPPTRLLAPPPLRSLQTSRLTCYVWKRSSRSNSSPLHCHLYAWHCINSSPHAMSSESFNSALNKQRGGHTTTQQSEFIMSSPRASTTTVAGMLGQTLPLIPHPQHPPCPWSPPPPSTPMSSRVSPPSPLLALPPTLSPTTTATSPRRAQRAVLDLSTCHPTLGRRVNDKTSPTGRRVNTGSTSIMGAWANSTPPSPLLRSTPHPTQSPMPLALVPPPAWLASCRRPPPPLPSHLTDSGQTSTEVRSSG